MAESGSVPSLAVTGCTMPALPLYPAASAPSLAVAKAGAILGGMPSALDAIRAQQTAPLAPVPALLAAGDVIKLSLAPGSGPVAPMAVPCENLAASRGASGPGMLAPLDLQRSDPEDFLSSKRIRIGRTTFDKDWTRVSREKLSANIARRHLGALPASREQSLSAVNRWVNHRIRYAEDRDQYGVSDFWAGARKTLKAGRGDCEDIALVKMQLLAAAGVARDDMILTIARDLVRNADHAVLIVRTDAGYRLLDNATDEVLDAAPSHDYRPILSFGNQASWLHGV